MVKREPDNVFIQKSQSCPPHLTGSHLSRWAIAKIHMKERLVTAGERLGSPSFRADMAPLRKEYEDAKPIALVGPVIGLVTSTAARILLEVDRDATVQMILHKEESPMMRDDATDDSRLRRSKNRLLRGSSSLPAWLWSSKPLSRSGMSDAARSDYFSSPDSSVCSSHDSANLQGASTSWKEGPSSIRSRFSSSSEREQCRQSDTQNLQEDSIASRNFRQVIKEENETAEKRVKSSKWSVWSPYGVPKSTVKKSFRTARGAHSLQRRISPSFMKFLRKGSSLSSSLLEQSSFFMSQGGGGTNKQEISVTQDLKARRATIFKFEMLEQGSRYIVEVKDCHEVEQSSFKTFSTNISNQFCMASISCNSIFITKKTITMIDDLWHHLSKSIESNEVNLLIHLGDQIYGDGDRHLDASAGKNRYRWSNRFKIGLHMLKDMPEEKWASKFENICEKYREVYRDTWRHPYTAKCLANCSSLMIYDDHEIRDNWGDNPRDWRKDCKEYFVAKCAWMVTLEYQRQLFEDVDFSNLDAIQKDHYFHVLDKIGLMFLDIRGSRTFHRVENDSTPYLGLRQWQDIDEALGDGGLFDKVQVLVICSPAPLVFLVPAVTVAAPSVVDRLEDFRGHWSAYKHEQKRMIDSLQRWKESHEGREVIILGGDVHCGGHSCICKSEKTLFNQLTTSPIANMPLPKTVYYAMRFAEQLERIEGFRFHHFNWTRARNYGLVRVNFLKKDENGVPEVTTELVKGKFLRPVSTGRTVSNLETYVPTFCCAMLSFQSQKTRKLGMPSALRRKSSLQGGMSKRMLIAEDEECTSE